jgi:putative Mn2+ efflux pump MntP
MSLAEIIFIAVGLAMDAFAVSIAAGTSGRLAGKRGIFRLSFHFGLFQAMMPVIGWYAGISIAGLISALDHWIAFGLLLFVGIRMIKGGLDTETETFAKDPSRGASLVLLSIATSIDALAVGMSLAMLRVRIWYPSAVIGLITAALSVAGILAGKRIGRRFGSRMELAGGAILILIGLRILITQLLQEI